MKSCFFFIKVAFAFTIGMGLGNTVGNTCGFGMSKHVHNAFLCLDVLVIRQGKRISRVPGAGH